MSIAFSMYVLKIEGVFAGRITFESTGDSAPNDHMVALHLQNVPGSSHTLVMSGVSNSIWKEMRNCTLQHTLHTKPAMNVSIELAWITVCWFSSVHTFFFSYVLIIRSSLKMNTFAIVQSPRPVKSVSLCAYNVKYACFCLKNRQISQGQLIECLSLALLWCERTFVNHSLNIKSLFLCCVGMSIKMSILIIIAKKHWFSDPKNVNVFVGFYVIAHFSF